MDVKHVLVLMFVLSPMASGCAAINSDAGLQIEVESEDGAGASNSSETDGREDDDESVVDLVLQLIQGPSDELESVSAHTAGGSIFEYPDIDAGIQQLLTTRAKTSLLFKLIRQQDLDTRARRRSYYAIGAVCVSKKGDPLPLSTAAYMAGRVDERLQHEPNNDAQIEIRQCVSRISRSIGLKLPEERR
ncbi:MAG: hypothetical protein AAGG48_28530 [Planctomycetota bacterium]